MVSPIDLDALPPQDYHNQNALLGSSISLTVLATIVVLLRMFTRITIVRKVLPTDWAMLVGWFCTFMYMIMVVIASKQYGMGLYGVRLTFEDMVTNIRITLAIQANYYAIVWAIKISILLFYLQLGVDQSFHLFTRLTIYFLTLFHATALVVVFLQCIPLKKMWDLMGTVSGHCINGTAFFYTTSGVNIITDVWILVLPVRTLYSVQRPQREKIALLIIFGMGVFSVIAAIVRLYTIRLYTMSEDPFYDAVPVNTWSLVECNIAIICASIPSVKPLFTARGLARMRGESTSIGVPKYPEYSSKGSKVSKGSRKRDKGTLSESIQLRSREEGSVVLDVERNESVKRLNSEFAIQKETKIEISRGESRDEEREFVPVDSGYNGVSSQVHMPRRGTMSDPRAP